MACRSAERGNQAREELLEKIAGMEDRKIKDPGSLLTVEILDLGEEGSIDTFVTEVIKEKYGGFDCLINNAGVLIIHGLIFPETLPECERVA